MASWVSLAARIIGDGDRLPENEVVLQPPKSAKTEKELALCVTM